MHLGRRAGDPNRLAQEGRLARIAFDEIDRPPAQDCQHQAGEAGAGPEVGDARAGRNERRKLCAVQHMAAPGIGEGGGADQVDPLLPSAQQVEVPGEAVHCFT